MSHDDAGDERSGKERERQLGWVQHQTNTGEVSAGERLQGERKPARKHPPSAQGAAEQEREGDLNESSSGGF